MEQLNEKEITRLVKEYLIGKKRGNWHEETVRTADGHTHGPDLVVRGGLRNSEYYIVECKGKSCAKSARSINKEGWLTALGQLVTRMDTERVIQTGSTKGAVNNAYKYGLGLYWVGAQVALRRVPQKIARTLNLRIFSVSEDGWVREWTPKDFGKAHEDSEFQRPEP